MPIDPAARIAPTARVHPEASIGPGCVIGEFCVIEQDTVLGPNCVLEPYVFIKRWTTLGEANEISASTVLGTDPLDKNFTGERSYLNIGHRNKIREHFTISRATKPEAATTIGDGNFIMTSGHIAHDCRLGDNIVVASCALLAGYVEVGDRAFISGGVVVHQYSKIGALAMIGGNTRVNSDLPPFFLYSDFNVAAKGVNVVGLRRAGFSSTDIQLAKDCFRLLYRSGLKLQAAIAQLEQNPHPIPQQLASFLKSSTRGIARETASPPDQL
jgi:UDP-N-acetylglucosamine acyltransferase